MFTTRGGYREQKHEHEGAHATDHRRGSSESAMDWTTPELTEVNMSSEIGSYQEEFDPERDPRFIDRDAEPTPTER
jgi:hypothetical protein